MSDLDLVLGFRCCDQFGASGPGELRTRLLCLRLTLCSDHPPPSRPPALPPARAPHLPGTEPLSESDFAEVPTSQTRIVIFTSGTTGNPKGVNLPYTCYECNRASFEQFLGFEDPTKPLVTPSSLPIWK